MPCPIRLGGPPMMAVMNPEGIYHCTKRGFHIQTTPLSGNHQLLLDQVNAFNRAKGEMDEDVNDLTITLSRVAYVATNASERDRKIAATHRYYGRFDKVRNGPGLVKNGMIQSYPAKHPLVNLERVY